MNERIIVPNDKLKHVQAYIDYRNIVGNDDNGKMMSDKEFEDYKSKVKDVRKNHLYVYWVNSKNYECKAIGPESMCFCEHRYKSHNFDEVKTKKVSCKEKGCKCKLFNYIPVYGSKDIKCYCKHSSSLHDPFTRKCGKCTCSGFGSSSTCNCRESYDNHTTIIETKEERINAGKSVDSAITGNSLAAGIGGLTSFQGMVNDLYGDYYKEILEGTDKLNMIDGDKKKYLSDKENISGSVTSKVKEIKGTNAFDLFKTPHSFNSKSGNSLVNKGFNKLSIR